MFLAKTYYARREQYKTRRQVLMLQTPNVDDERHATSHDRIALIRVIALSGIMRKRCPVDMPADRRNEFRVGRGSRKVRAMALYAIALLLEGIGNAVSQIAISEERKLMLRIRKRELPLVRLDRARSP